MIYPRRQPRNGIHTDVFTAQHAKTWRRDGRRSAHAHARRRRLGADDDEGRQPLQPSKWGRRSSALDRVEASSGPAALVITSSSPKFFSNGLDLDNLTVDELPVFVSGTFQPLIARLLEFPVPTVAALPGHAFAGGFMLALACDYRVMNNRRGYCCLNEAEIGLPLTIGMTALVMAKLAGVALRDAVLEARRFKADDAAALGVIDHAVPPDDVLPRAVELAQRVAKYGGDRFCVGKHKERMHAPATAALRAETAAAGREYRSKL